jgi:hypothetical protein
MLRQIIWYLRLTATVGSVVVLLVVGWPWADDYLRRRASVDHLEKLRLEFEQLAGRELQIAELNRSLGGKLELLNQRSLTPENEATVRDQLVEIIRENGCRVRQINLEEIPTRPWSGDSDDPLKEDIDAVADREYEYSLVSKRISLTLSGSLESIVKVVESIEARNYLAITENLSIQATSVTGEIVQMELRIRFFGIVPSTQEITSELSEDLVAGA